MVRFEAKSMPSQSTHSTRVKHLQTSPVWLKALDHDHHASHVMLQYKILILRILLDVNLSHPHEIYRENFLPNTGSK